MKGIIYVISVVLTLSMFCLQVKAENVGVHLGNTLQPSLTFDGKTDNNVTETANKKVTLELSTPVLVKDILPGELSSIYSITKVKNTVFFVIDDNGIQPGGLELWRSDGTDEGTVMLEDYPSPYYYSISNLTTVNDTLFFAACSSPFDIDEGFDLWKSNGTMEGTTMVKEIIHSQPGESISVNDTLFFAVAEYDHNFHCLWKSNGTEDGTTEILESGCGNIFVGELTNVMNTLFYVRSYLDGDDLHKSELWKSDGTSEGTVKVRDIWGSDLIGVGNTLLFARGDELWKSDGTKDGTERIKTLDGIISYLTKVSSMLFFVVEDYNADDGLSRYELLKSDGTKDGTVIVKGFDISIPDKLTDVNGTLFFVLNDNTNGDTLWKSDGTEEGTIMIKDINPNSLNSNLDWLTSVKGSLFFTADDGEHGKELWTSNGTKRGTKMVADINTGSASSDPYMPTYANGMLFFSADDGIHGRELWKIDVAPVILEGIIKDKTNQKDKFTLRMECEAFDNVLSDTEEIVKITIGQFQKEVPVGSFEVKNGKYYFSEKTTSGTEKYTLTPATGKINFKGKKLSIMDGTTNPITVGIEIGDWNCLRTKEWESNSTSTGTNFKYR
jgi:ELWxxDGT repeat protein